MPDAAELNENLELSPVENGKVAKFNGAQIVAFLDPETHDPVDPNSIQVGKTRILEAVNANGEALMIAATAKSVDMTKPGEYWWKIMMSGLLDVLEDLSGKQTQALRAILDTFDPKSGMVICTQEEFVEKSGTSKSTVNRVLKLLRKHDLIRMKSPGVYVINPDFMRQGGEGRYHALLVQYRDARQVDEARGKRDVGEEKRIGQGS